jgi:hypothetical protein
LDSLFSAGIDSQISKGLLGRMILRNAVRFSFWKSQFKMAEH